MAKQYTPGASHDSFEFRRALESYDGTTVAELGLFRQRLAENKLPLEELRALFAAPRALASALNDLRVQRPFGCLRDYANHGYGHQGVLRSWLRADGVAKLLSSDWAPYGNDYLPSLDRIYDALSSEMDGFYGRRHVTKNEEPDADELLARQTLVIPYLSLGGIREELPRLIELLRDSFASVGLHFPWRFGEDARLLERFEGCVPIKPNGVGIELLRFGLLETSYGEGGRTMAEIEAKLPMGARFAGLETFAAIAQHPRLLGWMNSDPAGGSGAAEPCLWLPGLGASPGIRDRVEHAYMTVGASGPLRLPRLGVPCFYPMSLSEDGACGFIPYVIPVKLYTSEGLLALSKGSRR